MLTAVPNFYHECDAEGEVYQYISHIFIGVMFLKTLKNHKTMMHEVHYYRVMGRGAKDAGNMIMCTMNEYKCENIKVGV
jgi:hypothetical protein